MFTLLDEDMRRYDKPKKLCKRMRTPVSTGVIHYGQWPYLQGAVYPHPYLEETPAVRSIPTLPILSVCNTRNCLWPVPLGLKGIGW